MLHTIRNKYLTVSVSEKGAELQSIRSIEGIEYLWQGDPAYWSDRSLNIFPYVARLNNGSYFLDGVRHHMQIHGIAPYRDFQCVSNNGKSMTFQLVADSQTYISYPRIFSFSIKYTLNQNVLEIQYEVENRDQKDMYFGLGGHPGFNVPLSPDLQFSDYYLKFGTPCEPVQIGFTEECYRSGTDMSFPMKDGQILPLCHELFDQDAIVLRDVSRAVTLACDCNSHSVTVTFPDMPFLGLWHWPKTDAPYICIEPWCSLPSCAGQETVFENQADLIKLAPSECYINNWTIEIN